MRFASELAHFNMSFSFVTDIFEGASIQYSLVGDSSR